MKKIILFTLFILSVQFLIAAKINTQGVLRDADNKAVPDAEYSITFRIYASETGGSSLYDDTQSIQVTNGVYNATLTINDELYGESDLWLSLQVGGDSEMSRVRLHFSPYDQLDLAQHGNAILTSGNVGIGTESPEHYLHINKTSDIGIDDNAPYAFAITEGEDLNLTMTKEGKIRTSSDAIIDGSLSIANRLNFKEGGYWSNMILKHPVAGSSPRLYIYGEDANGEDTDFSIYMQDSEDNTTMVLNSSGRIDFSHGFDTDNLDYQIDMDATTKLNDVYVDILETTNYVHVDKDNAYPVLYGGEDASSHFLIRPGNSSSYRNSISIDGANERVGINVYNPFTQFDINNRFMFHLTGGYWNDFIIRSATSSLTSSRLYMWGYNSSWQQVNVELFALYFTVWSVDWATSARSIDNGLNSIMSLNPIMYNDDREPDRNRIGFDALNVLDIFPELVSEPVQDDDPYGINYGGFTPVLTKAIQELKTEKDAEIKELENTIKTLIERIEELENK